MPTNYLTDFYAEIRGLYNKNACSRELTDSVIKAGKDQACLVISRLKPRANQRADVAIDSSNSFIDLPANFYSAYLDAVYRLKYNTRLTDKRAKEVLIDTYKKQSYSFGASSSRFNAAGRVRAFWGEDCDENESVSIEIFSNGKKGWSLWLDPDQMVSTRTEKQWPYNAVHEITADLDTITNDIRDIFKKICLQETLLEAQRQAAKDGKADIAKIYGDQAREYGYSLADIGSTGAAD